MKCIFGFISWHEAYKNWLMTTDLSQDNISIIYNLSIIALTIIVSIVLYHLVAKLIYYLLDFLSKKEKGDVLNALVKNKFFSLLGYYAPLIVVKYNLGLMLNRDNSIMPILDKGYDIFHVILFVLLINSLLDTFVQVNQYKVENHSKPIKGLVQFIQIVLYFISGIVIISILIEKNTLTVIGGLGAASAIVMLIFKDSITGVIAGVQLSFNKMIEIGDWISLPKYAVDGEVIDITITSVKVKNWDESISSVPSYNLVVSDSVKNWKGMVKSDSRCMSRAIRVDLLSIKFCTPEDIIKYNQILGVENALKAMSQLDGGDNITNIGLFRAYTYYFLNNNKDINSNKDLIVRQREPDDKGLPIEIYCFTNTSKWRLYEDIQSDVLDHLIAILPRFDLSVFQARMDLHVGK